MTKILVSDYDKTFFLNEEDIEKNKKAVEAFRKNGNIFVIATGRSYLDLKAKIEQYNIPYDYMIINHGATIIGKDDDILYNFTINDNIIFELKKDLEIEKNNIEYLSYKPEKSKNNIYFCCSALESRLDFDSKNITKIAVIYDGNVNVERINRLINEKYADIIAYHVSENMIEIISKNINKSKAIKLLADYYNLNEASVYTIGDGYSDISMIKDYNGYAMKNSVSELKNVAIKMVDSVSDLINEIN